MYSHKCVGFLSIMKKKLVNRYSFEQKVALLYSIKKYLFYPLHEQISSQLFYKKDKSAVLPFRFYGTQCGVKTGKRPMIITNPKTTKMMLQKTSFLKNFQRSERPQTSIYVVNEKELGTDTQDDVISSAHRESSGVS